MSAITVGADEEHSVALRTGTDSLKENRFAVSLRQASSQAEAFYSLADAVIFLKNPT